MTKTLPATEPFSYTFKLVQTPFYYAFELVKGASRGLRCEKVEPRCRALAWGSFRPARLRTPSDGGLAPADSAQGCGLDSTGADESSLRRAPGL